MNKRLKHFQEVILDNADIIKVEPSSKIVLIMEVRSSTNSHMTKVETYNSSRSNGYSITEHELIPIKHTQLKSG